MQIKCKRIFVNASTAKYSGGMIVATDIIRQLASVEEYEMLVVAPGIDSYRNVCARKKLIVVPKLLYLLPVRWFLDYFWLPVKIKSFKPHVVITLTNLPVITSIPQIFFHDNPYITNNYRPVQLSRKQLIIHKLRNKSFFGRIKFVQTFVTQTDNENKLLQKKITSDVPIVTLPPFFPYYLNESDSNVVTEKGATANLSLIYPSNFYAHKNFNFLIKLARIAKEKNIAIEFFITLNPKGSKQIKKLLNSIVNEKLAIINLGKLSPGEVISKINDMDAVIVPSLFETYGLNCIEAWHCNKPLIISDLSFAESVCGKAAKYVDLKAPEKALNEITELLKNNNEIRKLTDAGKQKIKALADISMLMDIIEQLLQ